MATKNKWLPLSGAAPATEPALRLFCFPQSGTGAWVYKAWQKALPESVQVMPVEFPGRSTRAGEANAESMPELVSALVDGLMPAFEERPFAFFGHSFGTWVAFAVAQELQARGGPLPQKLYASAMRSPSLAAPEHDAEGDGLLMHTLGPDEFWAAMTRRYGQFSEQQADPAVRAMMYPMLLADFKINETFAPVIAAPLPCRIAALGGEGDGRATRAQMDAWAEVAEPGKATVTMFPGGHFYLFKKEESMGAFFKFFYKDLLREAAVAAPPPPARGQLSSGSFRRPLADGVAGRQAAAFWAAAGVEVPPPLAPAPALPPPATLAELLAGRPDAPALIDGASGARLTREELSGQVAAFAAALTAAGVGAGQVVALACPNDLQLVVGLLGAAAIAAVAAPLNPASLPAEFAFTLGDLAPALLVCSAGHPSAAAALAAAAAAGVPAGTASAAGGVVALSAPLLRDGARAPTPRAPAPADVALVVHAAAGTAATRPRAAALTHANLSAAAAAAAAAYELGRADVSLLATPLWQLPALVSDLLAALLSGGPAVLPSRPDGFATAAAFWGDVAAHGVSRLTAPPPALAVLLKHAPRWADAGRPPLRFISAAGGGAVLGPGVLAEVEAAFGAPVLEALALPMVGLVAAAPLPHRGRRAPGTAGRAVPGLELSVVAAGGQEGELLVRGPAVFSTFWGGGGAAGGDALDPDGWHATGVRARVDADGQLHVRPGDGVGGISWFGERRDAGEVEAALSGWGPAGARLVAFAAPHRVLGEVVAVAVAGGGAAGGPAALEELRAHAAATGALPPHWLPSAAVFCPGGLPTGPDGQEVPREGLAAALGLPLLAGRAPAAFALAPDGSLSQVAAARGRALTRAVSSLAAASEEGGEVEAAVAGAYAQALGVPADAVQPSSNFFELGGTSLQVAGAVADIHRATGILLTPAAFFASPTVQGAAAAVLAGRQRGALTPAPAPGAAPPPVLHVPAGSDVLAAWNPASYQQEHLLQEGWHSTAAACRLRGGLDAAALRAAAVAVVAQEPVLRTALRRNEDTGRVEQLARRAEDAPLCLEFAAHVAPSPEEALRLAARLQHAEVAPGEWAGTRVDVVSVAAQAAHGEEHLVLINAPALGNDPGAAAALRAALLARYAAAAAAAGGGAAPPEPAAEGLTYLDFALWQHQWLRAGGAEAAQVAYWREELAGAPSLELPLDRPRPPAVSPAGAAVPLRIPPALAAAWAAQLHAHGHTLYMGALALFQVLLARWSSADEVVVGAAAANRHAHPGLAGALGAFAGALPIRVDLSGRPGYLEVVERVRAKLLQAWAAQDVPAPALAAALGARRPGGAPPLFQAAFSLEGAAPAALPAGAEPLALPAKVCEYTVQLCLRRAADGGLEGELRYATDLLGEASAARLAAHFCQLAAAAAAGAEGTPVNLLQMLAPEEERVIVREWNDSAPSPPFPAPARIESLIAAAAAARPHSVAVEEASGRACTYAELVARGQALAGELVHGRGCRPGDRVVLCFDKEIEMIVATVACLMAGCAYVPVDVKNTPVARVAFMLEDTEARLAIVAGHYAHLEGDMPAGCAAPFATFEALEAAAGARAPAPLPPPGDASALAVLIYTSGTTGLPKGVMISHSNLCALVHGWCRLVDLGPDDKVLQFSSSSFVMSLRQVLCSLCAGATLVLPADSLDFGAAIARSGVTKLSVTPSALATLDPAAVPTLTHVQIGGEPPALALCNKWAAALKGGLFVSLGLSEATAHACLGRFTPGDGAVSVGPPMWGVSVYVVNEEGQLQPEGVVGELWIAGDNVAQGYIRNPELTAAQFVANPFDAARPRAYRTGDFARWLPGGRIQFMGRRDAQVKIHGFRIELSEIVTAVLLHPALTRAEVTLVGDQLVAFVTPGVGADVVAEAAALAKKTLPAYMLPRRIIPLPDFPLTKNGKLDRGAMLAAADAAERAAPEAAVPLATEAQRRVAEVWAAVTERPAGEVFANSSFFDLGGSSLTAIAMAAAVKAALGVALPPTAVFGAPTVAEFAAAVEAAAGKEAV